MLWRDYRERRGSATSMDIQPKRREKKKKTQTFYPSPQSFSEADQYEYSSEDEDDDSSFEGDFKKTLVSSSSLLSTGMQLQRNAVHHYFLLSAWSAANARETLVDPFSAVKNVSLFIPPCRDYFYFSFSISSRLLWFFCCRALLVEEYMNQAASDFDRAYRIKIVRLHVKVKSENEDERWIHPKCM